MDLIAIRDYARGLLGKAATSGWRPFFGWAGGIFTLQLLYFAFITVPTQNLNVPDQFYWGVLGWVTLYISTFVARGVEKQMELRAPLPGGGLVNNTAITA